MIEIYECEHCEEQFGSKEECEKHERICEQNPANWQRFADRYFREDEQTVCRTFMDDGALCLGRLTMPHVFDRSFRYEEEEIDPDEVEGLSEITKEDWDKCVEKITAMLS